MEVTIESADPILFHVDGEPVQGGRTVTGRVRPGALQIVT
jgi:diacylglycerol kinase family enzyme